MSSFRIKNVYLVYLHLLLFIFFVFVIKCVVFTMYLIVYEYILLELSDKLQDEEGLIKYMQCLYIY